MHSFLVFSTVLLLICTTPVFANAVQDFLIRADGEEFTLRVTYAAPTNNNNPDFLHLNAAENPEEIPPIERIEVVGFTSLTRQQIADIAWQLRQRETSHHHQNHLIISEGGHEFSVPRNLHNDGNFLSHLGNINERRDGYYALMLETLVLSDYFQRFGSSNHPMGFEEEVIDALKQWYPDEKFLTNDDLLLRVFSDLNEENPQLTFGDGVGISSDLFSILTTISDHTGLAVFSMVLNVIDTIRTSGDIFRSNHNRELRELLLSILHNAAKSHQHFRLFDEIAPLVADPAFDSALQNFRSDAVFSVLTETINELNQRANLIKNGTIISLSIAQKIALVKYTAAIAKVGETTQAGLALSSKKAAMAKFNPLIITGIIGGYHLYTNITLWRDYKESELVASLKGALSTKMIEALNDYRTSVNRGGSWELGDLELNLQAHNLYHAIAYYDLVNLVSLNTEDKLPWWENLLRGIAESLLDVSTADYLEWAWGSDEKSGQLGQYAKNFKSSYRSGDHASYFLERTQEPQQLRVPFSVAASQGRFPDGVRISWVAQSIEKFNVFRRNSPGATPVLLAERINNPYYFDTTAAYGSTYEYAVQSCHDAVCSARSNFIQGYVGNRNCALYLTPGSAIHAGQSGTYFIDVVTEPGCSWAATSSGSWISLPSGSQSGSGSKRISYTVANNQTTENRTGSITINGKQYPVTQNGSGPTVIEGNYQYILGSASSGMSGNEGYQRDWSVNVNDSEELARLIFWRYNEFGETPNSGGLAIAARLGSPPTIRCISGSSGCRWDYYDYQGESSNFNRNEVVTVPNPNAGTWWLRAYGLASFGNARIYFQKNTARCRPYVQPGSVEIAANGASQSLSVDMEEACRWNVSGAPAWLQVNNGSNRRGPGSFTIQANVNPGMENRSATLDIRGAKIHVEQRGQCLYLFDRNTLEFPGDGGFSVSGIRTRDGCQGSVNSSAMWLQVQDGTVNQIGTEVASQAAVVETASNPESTARTAILTVDNVEIPVTQQGGKHGLDVSTATGVSIALNNNLTPMQGASRVMLYNRGSVPLSATVVSDAAWVSVTPVSLTLAPGESMEIAIAVLPHALPNLAGVAALESAVRINISGGETLEIPVTVELPLFLVSVAREGSPGAILRLQGNSIDLVCAETCEMLAPPGSPVTVTVLDNGGYPFSSWSGACTDSNPICTVNVSQNTQVTAKFSTPTTYNLTVNSSGVPGVAITANPSAYGGITNYTHTGIASGTSITLTAPATAGDANFSNWSGCALPSGNNCTVAMTQDRTVTANYTPDEGNPIFKDAFEGSR